MNLETNTQLNPAQSLQNKFHKVWVCEVFSSGYHNGAKCSPEDPHGDWNCMYQYIAKLTGRSFNNFDKVINTDGNSDG